MLKSILFLSIFFISILCHSQIISFSQEEFDKVQIINSAVLTDTKNDKYGAGLSIDGNNMRVVLKEFKLNKTTNSVVLKGTTYYYANQVDDELRLGGIGIFMAKQKRNKLKHFSHLATSSTEKGKEGDFELTFLLPKKVKLYFDGGESIHLSIYDIYSLCKRK